LRFETSRAAGAPLPNPLPTGVASLECVRDDAPGTIISWTVTKTVHRVSDPQPAWLEENCSENNAQIRIGKGNYFIGADGLLMPAKKDQAPSDLKYFNQMRK
jgi:hypothetical protein